MSIMATSGHLRLKNRVLLNKDVLFSQMYLDGFVFEKKTFLHTTSSSIPSKNHLVSPSRMFIMDLVRDTLCLSPAKKPICQKKRVET